MNLLQCEKEAVKYIQTFQCVVHVTARNFHVCHHVDVNIDMTFFPLPELN